ncbi:MAG: hypothetical protein QOJ98_3238 [Acidobacteriota bacterium]|nr:hypothetical protein [Acidobacteriota bacterium]
MLRILLVALLLAPNAAQALEPADETTQRLAALGRVRGVVKHAHPNIALDPDLDWDAAGAAAIERTLNASNDEQFASITADMLAALRDGTTFVAGDCIESTQPVAPRTAIVTPGGSLYIPPGASVDEAAVDAATHVIFDLRPQPGRCTSANTALLATFAPRLFSGTASTPSQWKVHHLGYRSQNRDDAPFDIYDSSWMLAPSLPIAGAATGVRSATFVVDERSSLPEIAAAMVASGKASLLSVGPYRDLVISSKTVALPGGYHARIGTSALRRLVPARTTVGADASEATVIAVAEAGGNGRRRASGARGVLPPEVIGYRGRLDEPYPAMAYPDAGYRILGAYRYWNAIELFYPYKNLIGDWEPRLAQMIAKFANARSRVEYELAIAEAVTWVPDGHSSTTAAAFADVRGRAAPPFLTMPVEGKVVVTSLTDDSAAAAGIRPGDEVVAMDGRPIQERFDNLRPYISASHESGLAYRLARFAPWGPAGRSAYQFRRPDGSEYSATVERGGFSAAPPPLSAWRILDGNVGYVNLEFLQWEDIDRMMRDLRGTRAIIFDNRGYPLGTFPRLARLFNRTGLSRVAQMRIPEVIAAEAQEGYSEQDLGLGTPSQQYTNPTFMLIDERAISQSEHTGLVFEAIANTTFIGSPTAGANGNITRAVLPGGNYVTFTGMDVRHIDGRQLQRVGLVPHVSVPRTIAALAAGRDEVLEKALELARE